MPDHRPAPEIQALHRDAEGRLWLAIHVGGDEWASGLGPQTAGPHGPAYPVTDHEKVYDTRIEVLEEATGRLIGSVQIPQMVRAFVEDGLAAVSLEDELGVPRLELLRLTLRER